MPNYRRARVLGGCYFFTLVSWKRHPILTIPSLRTALRAAINSVRRSHPFNIDAWVLLPDHLHCIWTLPPDDADYPNRWSMIKRLTSQAIQGVDNPAIPGQRRKLGIWQSRYWEHLIRDQRDLHGHLDYLHWNPVKHEHVTRVADWPFSSFHRYVSEGKYPETWGDIPPDKMDGHFGE